MSLRERRQVGRTQAVSPSQFYFDVSVPTATFTDFIAQNSTEPAANSTIRSQLIAVIEMRRTTLKYRQSGSAHKTPAAAGSDTCLLGPEKQDLDTSFSENSDVYWARQRCTLQMSPIHRGLSTTCLRHRLGNTNTTYVIRCRAKDTPCLRQHPAGIYDCRRIILHYCMG